MKEAIPILDKLIAQMAAFAASIRKNPNDIADGISTAFKVAGSVTGLNLSELKAELDDVITMIKKDGSLSELFETALSEISKARIRIS